MCNKPGACCKHPKTEAAFPRVEAFTLPPVDSIVSSLRSLFHLTNSVARPVFEDPRIAELANAITSILAENTALRRFVGIFSPLGVQTNIDGITVRFGPKDSYTLSVPAPSESARKKLAAQLRAAADKLEAEQAQNSAQTVFPFAAKS